MRTTLNFQPWSGEEADVTHDSATGRFEVRADDPTDAPALEILFAGLSLEGARDVLRAQGWEWSEWPS